MTLQLIKEKDLAKILNVSAAKLSRDRFEKRGLPFYRLGRSIRYNLEKCLKSLEESPVKK